jgi:sugar phosphate isomerase/epimerase
MTRSRRRFIADAAALAGAVALARPLWARAEPLKLPGARAGILSYSCSIQIRRDPALGVPANFVAHAAALGFGGVQMPLGHSPDAVAAARDQAARRSMFLEAIVSPPRDEADRPRLHRDLRAAEDAGVRIVRMAMLGGRRYEQLRTFAEHRQFLDRARRQLEWIAAACGPRLRVAVENHKDFLSDELADALGKLGSERVGVCLDTGNSIALMEDPWHVVDTLAPLAITVHLKDMAVEMSPDGFLLAEVPLGRGMLDLPRIVQRVARANPAANFNLEMLTRDPLSIPCRTDRYRAVFDPSSIGPAIDRTLHTAQEHALPPGSLPRLSKMTPDDQAETERRHIAESITHMKKWAGNFE